MKQATTKILIPYGICKKLSELYGFSYPYIRKILNGNAPDNLTTQMVRKTAIELGGVELTPEN